ncbi:hypothetical protein HZA42_03360 [Candidatus Peregrinibacteria bacterium]|nr:hypothetical protein [Candidatus Peregrinibacteria bacterium]
MQDLLVASVCISEGDNIPTVIKTALSNPFLREIASKNLKLAIEEFNNMVVDCRDLGNGSHLIMTMRFLVFLMDAFTEAELQSELDIKLVKDPKQPAYLFVAIREACRKLLGVDLSKVTNWTELKTLAAAASASSPKA